MDWVATLGIVAAVSTTIAFFPQAIKTIRDKDTAAISKSMYSLFTIGTLLWLLYGIFTKNFPVILANAVTFALASVILFYKFRYK